MGPMSWEFLVPRTLSTDPILIGHTLPFCFVIVMRRSHELELLDSADAPLAVHRLHPDRYRQLRRVGPGPGTAAARVDNLLAPAAAVPAHGHRSLHVCAAVYEAENPRSEWVSGGVSQ